MRLNAIEAKGDLSCNFLTNLGQLHTLLFH